MPLHLKREEMNNPNFNPLEFEEFKYATEKKTLRKKVFNLEDLSRRLIEKSIEAFILGLEIYNKPTIKYRIEGFSFFIVNAWE